MYIARCGPCVQDDPIALAAVQGNGQALGALPESAGASRGLMLAAVEQSYQAVEYLHDDRDLFTFAVQQDANALQHAGPGVRSDATIIRLGLAWNLQYANVAITSDKVLVLQAVALNGHVLHHAHETLRSDRDVVTLAVQKAEPALASAGPELRRDPQLTLLAVALMAALAQTRNTPGAATRAQASSVSKGARAAHSVRPHTHFAYGIDLPAATAGQAVPEASLKLDRHTKARGVHVPGSTESNVGRFRIWPTVPTRSRIELSAPTEPILHQAIHAYASHGPRIRV
jgi:hypothetical protein